MSAWKKLEDEKTLEELFRPLKLAVPDSGFAICYEQAVETLDNFMTAFFYASLDPDEDGTPKPEERAAQEHIVELAIYLRDLPDRYAAERREKYAAKTRLMKDAA